MFLFSWTSLFFGYSFNEAYHTSEFEKENVFSFLSWLSARPYFGIWVSFISQILFLVFQRTKAIVTRWPDLCVFILWWLHGNSMRLHPEMNERQLTYFRSLKNYHVLTFLAVSTLIPTKVADLLLCWLTHG